MYSGSKNKVNYFPESLVFQIFVTMSFKVKILGIKYFRTVVFNYIWVLVYADCVYFEFDVFYLVNMPDLKNIFIYPLPTVTSFPVKLPHFILVSNSPSSSVL